MQRNFKIIISAILFSGVLFSAAAFAGDPLTSWNDGASKSAILHFVQAVTEVGGKDFVPRSERIATFDNDGTLWSEQPMYVQLAFALDRVKCLATQHGEWQQQEPFKSILNDKLPDFHLPLLAIILTSNYWEML